MVDARLLPTNFRPALIGYSSRRLEIIHPDYLSLGLIKLVRASVSFIIEDMAFVDLR